MPVAALPTSNRHDLPLTDSSLSRERQVHGNRPRQSKVGRESVVIQSAKQSCGLEQVAQLAITLSALCVSKYVKFQLPAHLLYVLRHML
jgi:hypothetical protein